MIRLLGILLFAIILGACSKPPYTNVDNEQFKALLAQGVPLYDIRRPDEWRQTGVIKDSRLLTFVDGKGRPNPEFLPHFSAAVGTDEPVILICRTGNRSDVLARQLAKKLGYTRIYNVRHGITRWLSDRQAVIRN